MSVSLTYYSSAAVPSSVLSQISSHAGSLTHRWWAEGMVFFPDPEDRGRAYGDTKLFLLSTDPEDDSAMAWRDASFITTQLEAWSAAHGIVWVISCEGNTVGQVSGGIRDSDMGDFLASLLQIAELSSPVTPERLAAIDLQHADRWD